MKLFGRLRILVMASLATVFCCAFLRVHMRVQSTLIGYELGRLKAEEAELLEKRSVLQMDLARLTTKGHLSMMVSVKDSPQSVSAVAIR